MNMSGFDDSIIRDSSDKNMKVEDAILKKSLSAAEFPAQEQTECPGQEQTECPGQEQTECPGQEHTECPGQEQTECPGQEQTECPGQDQTEFESCVTEGFKVDSVVDKINEDASGEQNTNTTVKESSDTTTSSVADNKGKVSFKIDVSDDANKVDEVSASQKNKPKKARLNPKMLNRMKSLLLQQSHNSGENEFYIGDLINAVEGELLDLPKRRKRYSKQKERTQYLTKYKVRSINRQRRNICLNMEVLSSSMITDFENMDQILLNLHKSCSDFNAEFNQPHTPIGEPYAASLGMDELFVKTKNNLPILQDCFKEIKHCLRLYIRADMTLTDNLYNIVQTYFDDRLKEKHIPRVRYTEVLKMLMKSNRQHCELVIDSNENDKTSNELPDDKI